MLERYLGTSAELTISGAELRPANAVVMLFSAVRFHVLIRVGCTPYFVDISASRNLVTDGF